MYMYYYILYSRDVDRYVYTILYYYIIYIQLQVYGPAPAAPAPPTYLIFNRQNVKKQKRFDEKVQVGEHDAGSDSLAKVSPAISYLL